MVPHSIQPNIPALQCVRICTGSPFFCTAMASISGKPCTPIMRQVSMSSSTIRPASVQAASKKSVALSRAVRMRSKAQNKLTAVGRDALKVLNASSKNAPSCPSLIISRTARKIP